MVCLDCNSLLDSPNWPQFLSGKPGPTFLSRWLILTVIPFLMALMNCNSSLGSPGHLLLLVTYFDYNYSSAVAQFDCSSPVGSIFQLYFLSHLQVTLANAVLLSSQIRSSTISSQAFAMLDSVMASSRNLVLDLPDTIMQGFAAVSFFHLNCTLYLSD